MQPSSCELQRPMRLARSPLNAAMRAVSRTVGTWFCVVTQWSARLARSLAAERRRRRATHALQQFDDRTLADMGLTRGEIELAVRGHCPGRYR